MPSGVYVRTEAHNRANSEAKMGKRMGPDNTAWKGGVAYRSRGALKARRRLIRERGPYCEDCGADFSQDLRNLELHHKDRNRYNNEDSNLKLLGKKCHRKYDVRKGEGGKMKAHVIFEIDGIFQRMTLGAIYPKPPRQNPVLPNSSTVSDNQP